MNSLSGRFLVLTIVFVMVAEVLIFVPSVARFRQTFLKERLDRAQIASLALLGNDMLDPKLEQELLDNAGVLNVVLVRDDYRQLVLTSPLHGQVSRTFDLRNAGPVQLIHDAFARLLDPNDEMIRVIGAPARMGGSEIEVTMMSGPLRAAMITYGINILLLSLVISVITAGLLFFVVRSMLVMPISRLVEAMKTYATAPEDARRVIAPSARARELAEAEGVLRDLQLQLTAALKQKERLAQLGSAVAKVSHDLRNILTTAQLFADRVDMSKDPAVQRAAPKLMAQIQRAVALCEGTLAFGRAEEPAPALSHVHLAKLVDEVFDGERLAAGEQALTLTAQVPPAMTVRADPEQLYRVLTNLVRNARQALATTDGHGEVVVSSRDTGDEWLITVTDNGPGMPQKAQANIFLPFQAGVRKGGTGLGLVISQELIRGHGGRLELAYSGAQGTRFTITLPQRSAMLEDAAE